MILCCVTASSFLCLICWYFHVTESVPTAEPAKWICVLFFPFSDKTRRGWRYNK